ncbi:FG-GAP-like repeat-containing protein [Actinokineospora soli]|uniref:FG-GAP-like repeat-containing protein n=1 Tax=Actinokineospora soli TaxID=1048753 RepID=A0ABW2TXP8_9PSEU
MTITVGPNPYGVAVADLDEDGDADLAVTVAGQDSVAVLGNGDGTFTPATTLGVNTWPTEIHAADLDVDGRVDLVTTNRHADGISVLLNRTERPVPPTADVSVKLTANPNIGLLISEIRYTLTIRNLGPDALQSGTVSTPIPAGVKIVPGSGCSVAAGVLTCSTGALAVNGSVVRKFTHPLSALSIGTLRLTATRTASTPADPNAANDKSTSTCSVVSILLVTCR